MAKRKRRERDRPKAAPDAFYNPNKRVLLSYDSDKDDQTNEPSASSNVNNIPPLDERSLRVQHGPYESMEERNPAHNHEEDCKAQSNPVQEGKSTRNQSSKSTKTAGRGSGHRIRANSVTGQRPALGSLGYQWDKGEDDEDQESADEDALAYLRAVRSERHDMPSIFYSTSNKRVEDPYDENVGDGHGLLQNGVYSGRPTIGPQLPPDARTTLEPEEVYTDGLKTRFRKLHMKLHEPPTADALAALEERRPISFPSRNNRAFAEWSRLVTQVPPSITQLQAMDLESVSNVLQLIARLFVLDRKHIERTVSAWLFALLARLDEVGSMDNDQVSALREIAKKAAAVQSSIESAESSVTNGDMPSRSGDTVPDTENCQEEDSELIQAQSKTGERLQSTNNTLASLDMILVLVGECFGQRDLLELRLWPLKR